MAVPNFAQNQSSASTADLSTNSPLTYTEERFKGGVEQITASEAAISQTPFNKMPANENTQHGMMQVTASEAPLSHEPMHSWNSYTTPISERSIKQSK